MNAAGELVTVTAESDRELFYALPESAPHRAANFVSTAGVRARYTTPIHVGVPNAVTATLSPFGIFVVASRFLSAIDFHSQGGPK